jgi:hypothetical protein
VSLEEESSPVIPYNNGNGTQNNNFIQVNDSVIRKYSDSLVPSSRRTIFEVEKEEEPKEPVKVQKKEESAETKQEKWRRKSIGLGLLSRNSNTSNQQNQNYKRRSSIAGAFLGRYKHRDPNPNGQSNVEKYRKSTESSDAENDPPIITVSENYDLKEKKRRKSSWQAKLERRRRKENPSISDQDIVEFNTNGTNYLDQVDPMEYRQKRHSWWNIFVPDNLKNR